MPKLVDEQRLRDCVDLLLTMQNPDGGFASYELVRGNKRLEWLNTAEVFGEFWDRGKTDRSDEFRQGIS